MRHGVLFLKYNLCGEGSKMATFDFKTEPGIKTRKILCLKLQDILITNL